MIFKPMRSFLLVALSGTVLGSAPCAVAQTVAPELQFYPANGWTLSKNDQSCVLSSAFNNGFTLSLNGSDDWVEALAVDFQQTIFEPGKIYNVTLNVPGVTQTRYEGVATNASTISLNFKESRKTYKAMRSAAVLDMNVEDNDFRFYLTGFSNEANGFERCMAGGGVKAKPSEDSLKTAAADIKDRLPEPEEKPLPLVDAKAQQLISTVQNLKKTPEAQDFTANEAQEMEASVKARKELELPQTITEILPEDPQPVIQEIPVKETVKVKDTIVEERIVFNDPKAEKAVVVETSSSEAEPIDLLKESPAQSLQEVETQKTPEVVVASVPTPEEKPTPEPVLKVEPAKVAAPPAPTPEPVAPAKTREQLMAAAMLAEIEKNPDIIANGGGLVDFRQRAGARVSVPTKEIPTPQPKAVAAPQKVADVMLPDEKSSAPETLQKPVEAAPQPKAVPETLPALDTRDIEPIEAVKPNEKAQEPKKPLTPLNEEPVQLASSHEQQRTPKMRVQHSRASADADFTALEPAASSDMGDPRLASRIADLERQLMSLKRENEALNDDLKVTLREAEDERMSISSENWNLERATMRYNEAERQIKRLAQQLQKERAKHRAEIRELEAMLFDPQVTNETQMARLADLETQLLETQEELRQQRMTYEERIRALETQLAQ